jgi:hypothetical protein
MLDKRLEIETNILWYRQLLRQVTDGEYRKRAREKIEKLERTLREIDE